MTLIAQLDSYGFILYNTIMAFLDLLSFGYLFFQWSEKLLRLT